MIIKVTQENIDAGYRDSCSSCPVALALHRVFNKDTAFEQWETIRVGSDYARIGDCVYILPKIAEEFITAFDARLPVEPIEFEITLR